jgi:ribosomal small subunit protein bTHX
MGKGDKKSKKGKRFRHSYGKTRTRKGLQVFISKRKAGDKQKPLEQKKQIKTEPEIVKPPVVIEPQHEEIKIAEPEISEIKEEVKTPEVIETSVTEIPEIASEPVMENPEPAESIQEAPKSKTSTEKKPAAETPKKRGRPKKKKDE